MQPLAGSPNPPEALSTEYAAWSWQVVWQYGPEAITYRLTGRSGEKRYLKLAPVDHYPSLDAEAARMSWARKYLPVPSVLDCRSEGAVAWLVTTELPGLDATHPSLTADPAQLVPMLADGLRMFHGAPVQECPFDFRLDAALVHVRDRLEAGRIQPARDFHPEFAHLSAESAVGLLEEERPPDEDLVVCHGDFCPPNVLVQDGVATGIVDLGELGVADRWWDLAVATWSLTWNLGPGYEDLFLASYGVGRDAGRQRFYRLLYDLVS